MVMLRLAKHIYSLLICSLDVLELLAVLSFDASSLFRVLGHKCSHSSQTRAFEASVVSERKRTKSQFPHSWGSVFVILHTVSL